MATRKKPTTFDLLREHALSFPEAHEEHPWGETAIKVRGKTFVFMGDDGLSAKLPESGAIALALPFAEPTHYGLGKSGWVSARFGADVSLDLLKAWIDESYRAIAPKKLVAALPVRGAAATPADAAPKPKVTKKRPSAKPAAGAASPKTSGRKAARAAPEGRAGTARRPR